MDLAAYKHSVAFPVSLPVCLSFSTLRSTSEMTVALMLAERTVLRKSSNDSAPSPRLSARWNRSVHACWTGMTTLRVEERACQTLVPDGDSGFR